MSLAQSSQRSGPGAAERFALLWRHALAKLWLLLGRRVAAAQIFRELLARAPHHLAALNSLGYAALQHGQYAQALTYFDQVLQQTPALANAHFNRAFVCEAMGMLQDAEQSFRAAIEREALMDRAWYGLGLVLVRQGRLSLAAQAFKRNTELQPMSPFGWYQLARVHLDLHQTEQAQAILQHLKGFEPKVAAQLAREMDAL
jgi:tetratricopeptide (TPR) repeat protein